MLGRACQRRFLVATLVAAASASVFSPVEAARRTIAIGDVHGAYASFVAVLAASGLVDDQTAWVGGDARLVVLGDVLDRGAESRRALELVMRLQSQAVSAGGTVELVLGNHEVMNLIGDLRYVAPAEFAAYAADEPADEREAAWQRFRVTTGNGADARARFEARYPPGFFAHRAAFAPDGGFGAWLLERPVLAVFDGTAFVHGGLPASLEGQGLGDINRDYTTALREYLADVARLETAGTLHREDSLTARAALVDRYLAATAAAPGALRQAAERVRAFVRSPLLSDMAVFWYRGTAACSPAIEQARLDAILAGLEADRVVIGHTPTATGRVSVRLSGRVVRADTGMLPAYGGQPSAVIIDDGEVLALSLDSREATAPPIEPRVVGRALGSPADDVLETLLTTMRPATRAAQPDGSELWTLVANGAAIDAVFRPAPRRGFPLLPEVAAYRLDRRLGLDLVPVAVRRELDGRVGSLSLDASGLPTETQRAADPSAGDAWCPLRDQFNAMYAFDALAGNPGRRPAAVRYRTADWALVLADNDALFGATTAMPAYLRDAPIEITGELAARLGALDARSLTALVGDVLDARRRAALLARRDELLAR